jgi:hypothetical protein
MVRNPFETMPSIQKMVLRNYKASGTDPSLIDSALEIVGQNSLFTYRHPFDVLARHPATRWAAIPYELLVSDPAGALRKLYADLEIPIGDSSREALARAEKHARSYKPSHDYSLSEVGLTPAVIRSALAPLFERFGWPEPAVASNAAPSERPLRSAGAESLA